MGLRVLALCHMRHVLVQLRRHFRRGDTGRELRERVDDGHTQLAGLDGIVLEVANLVQALDDARARGLGTQAALLHLLDQLALAVACGRLGLLGLQVDVVHVHHIAGVQRGQLFVALEAIRVGFAEAGIHQHVAGGSEGLAGDIDGHLGVLDGRGTHERSQEAAGDEVVELELAAIERGGVALARRVNGRVIGGLRLAARGLHGAGQDLLAHGRQSRRIRRQALHDALEVERARVDGVVDARVGDKTAHIEALGDSHGASGADSLCGRRRLQGGGVERHRGLLLARALGDIGNGSGCDAVHMAKSGLSGVFVRKARRCVADLKVRTLGCRHAADLPVILWHKCHALALALYHQGKRGRLHAAGGTDVAKTTELGERKVAGQHRTPDKVDILTALARIRQVLIELNQIVERLGHLALNKRGVTGAAHGHVRRHLAHARQGVRANELTLAVEVRRDHHGVGFLRQVLENADDLFLRGILDDGRPRKVGQALDLPTLDVDAVGKERLALGVVRRAGKTVRYLGAQYLAVFGQRVPSLLLIEEDLIWKVRRQNMAGKAHGHPLLALHVETIDGRVVNLVVFRLAGSKKLRNFLRGDIFLCNDELQRGSFAIRSCMVSSIATKREFAKHA